MGDIALLILGVMLLLLGGVGLLTGLGLWRSVQGSLDRILVLVGRMVAAIFCVVGLSCLGTAAAIVWSLAHG